MAKNLQGTKCCTPRDTLNALIKLECSTALLLTNMRLSVKSCGFSVPGDYESRIRFRDMGYEKEICDDLQESFVEFHDSARNAVESLSGARVLDQGERVEANKWTVLVSAEIRELAGLIHPTTYGYDGLGLIRYGVVNLPQRFYDLFNELQRRRVVLQGVADKDQTDWLTVTEAAVELTDCVSGLTIENARARVSFAANEDKFTTNGHTGKKRRIERNSFMAWLWKQREIDLAKCDEGF